MGIPSGLLVKQLSVTTGQQRVVFVLLRGPSHYSLTHPPLTVLAAIIANLTTCSTVSLTTRAKMLGNKLRLIYFDIRSRAEVSRLLLAAAGQEYEDVRISHEEWADEKPKTPFGQVPVLEVNGKKYAQSVAIVTYLAREFGLYGQTNLDGLEIDQIVQLNQDFRNKAVTALREPDETRKAELLQNVKEVEGPKYLGFLEKLLKESGTGYFVGESLTLADISTYDNVYAFSVRGPLWSWPDPDSKYPLLQENYNRVENVERIKAYLANRKPADL
ncbi:unnamed protein product [Lymnaea stagnalis]|uniref:Glutathione S-transferase n=1 Tax=Lymnaea stagnalis TaxID=6523 RepID=A0AAV2H5I8_LYMST